jgi:8-oxo-dGTP pyrophosphatase MutT (NUDIX family)
MVEGVVVVVQRGERFLFIERAEHVRSPGAWCFVGGAMLDGETQEAAVIREFQEEIAGTVMPLTKVWEYRTDGLLLHWWEAALLTDDLAPNPAEVARFAWLTADEALALPHLLPSNREFLEKHRQQAE